MGTTRVPLLHVGHGSVSATGRHARVSVVADGESAAGRKRLALISRTHMVFRANIVGARQTVRYRRAHAALTRALARTHHRHRAYSSHLKHRGNLGYCER